jgi:D-aspartate ligase
VIGLDDVRGVYAARTLAGHGVPVVGIAKRRGSYGSRTNACREILYADVDGPELIELLLALAPRLPNRPVLLPCLDRVVLNVSRNRDELEPHFRFALPRADVVEMLTDKVAFYTFAAEQGFRIPHTHFLAERSEAEAIGSEIEYPCVLKPPSSKSAAWLQATNLKAFKVQDRAELLRLYDDFRSAASPLILQEWVPGRDDRLHACISYLDEASNPLVVFTSRKIRQWPPETGEISLGEECENAHIASETLRLLASVEFRGLAYVEFKHHERTGEYVLIEPNIGRPAVRSGIVEAAGIELLYTLYCDLAGLALPAGRGQRYRGVKWLYLRRDLLAAFHYWRKGELTPREWLRSLRGPKAYALFSRDDPVPFFADLASAARLSLVSGERRRRDFGRPVAGERVRSGSP